MIHPLVIEVGGAEKKIEMLLPDIDEIVKEGLVTMEQLRIIKCRAKGPK